FPASLAVLGSTFSFIVGCNDTASVDSYLPKTVGFYLPKIVDAKLPLTLESLNFKFTIVSI
ncbi:MAG: hypothetical protein IJK78_12640, partial [Bacteroidales bacterium]|nr:hypothetical protein [Bacteroidales bacterium]